MGTSAAVSRKGKRDRSVKEALDAAREVDTCWEEQARAQALPYRIMSASGAYSEVGFSYRATALPATMLSEKEDLAAGEGAGVAISERAPDHACQRGVEGGGPFVASGGAACHNVVGDGGPTERDADRRSVGSRLEGRCVQRAVALPAATSSAVEVLQSGIEGRRTPGLAEEVSSQLADGRSAHQAWCWRLVADNAGEGGGGGVE